MINTSVCSSATKTNIWLKMDLSPERSDHDYYTHSVTSIKTVSVRRINLSNKNNPASIVENKQNEHIEVLPSLDSMSIDTIQQLDLSQETDVLTQIEGESAALLAASEQGDVLAVTKLIEHGAMVNQSFNDGSSALIVASRNGHIYTVRQLMSTGANVNHSSFDGTTSLIVACKNGHKDVVEELIANSAQVDAARANGFTALMYFAGIIAFQSQEPYCICNRFKKVAKRYASCQQSKSFRREKSRRKQWNKYGGRCKAAYD